MDFCLPFAIAAFNLLRGEFMAIGPELERSFLRHTLATIAYRGAKPLRDAPASFGTTEIGGYPRTPVMILAHINDIFDWALSLARGKSAWNASTPKEWSTEVTRFFHGLKALDEYLASAEPLHESPEKMFQGADCRCADACWSAVSVAANGRAPG